MLLLWGRLHFILKKKIYCVNYLPINTLPIILVAVECQIAQSFDTRLLWNETSGNWFQRVSTQATWRHAEGWNIHHNSRCLLAVVFRSQTRSEKKAPSTWLTHRGHAGCQQLARSRSKLPATLLDTRMPLLAGGGTVVQLQARLFRFLFSPYLEGACNRLRYR